MPKVHGGQVYGAARAVGLTHEAAIVATAIAKGESGWDTDAHNDRGRDDSYGLWQINRKAHGDRFGTGDELRDIMANARAMAALSSGGTSWQPWTVYTSGEYRRHLAAARKAADAVVLKPNTAAGWESVARKGAGIKQGLGLGGLVDLGEGLAKNPSKIPEAAGVITGLGPSGFMGGLPGLIDAAGTVLAALGDPSWWRRVGVGALGALVLIAGLVFLGRDLITDTAGRIAGAALSKD